MAMLRAGAGDRRDTRSGRTSRTARLGKRASGSSATDALGRYGSSCVTATRASTRARWTGWCSISRSHGRVVPHAATALRPGGLFVAYTPSVMQVSQLREALEHSGFFACETLEVLNRAGTSKVRPCDRTTGWSPTPAFSPTSAAPRRLSSSRLVNGFDLVVILAAGLAVVGGWRLGLITRALGWVGAQSSGWRSGVSVVPVLARWISPPSDAGVLLLAAGSSSCWCRSGRRSEWRSVRACARRPPMSTFAGSTRSADPCSECSV